MIMYSWLEVESSIQTPGVRKAQTVNVTGKDDRH
jgi:hypothetical protein